MRVIVLMKTKRLLKKICGIERKYKTKVDIWCYEYNFYERVKKEKEIIDY